MYIDTKERGMIHEPLADLHKPLYAFLTKYQASLDGSRLYDDLIDVYQSQKILYQEALMISKMQKDIENPMINDKLWNDTYGEANKVVGECAGCGEDIVEGQDIYELDGYSIHSTPECCRDFVSERSECKLAGE